MADNTSLAVITQEMQDTDQILHAKQQAVGFVEIQQRLVGAKIRELRTKADMVLSEANLLEVNTDDKLVEANSFLVQLAPCIKKAEEYKDTTTKLLKQKLREIDNLFKFIIEPLTNASTLIRNKTIAYRREEQQAALEVQKILDEAGANTGPPSVTPPPITESKTVRVEGGQVGYTPIWTFEITNIDEIPIEHLRTACCTSRGREALESVIRNVVKGGVRKIAGVRIFESEQTVVRK